MTEGAAAASVVDHLCLEGVPRMDGGHEHTDRGLVEGGGGGGGGEGEGGGGGGVEGGGVRGEGGG